LPASGLSTLCDFTVGRLAFGSDPLGVVAFLVLLSALDAFQNKPRPLAQLNAFSPATHVSLTLIAIILSSAVLSGSLSRIVRSGSFPDSRVPIAS
jgi:hypothetical protein